MKIHDAATERPLVVDPKEQKVCSTDRTITTTETNIPNVGLLATKIGEPRSCGYRLILPPDYFAESRTFASSKTFLAKHCKMLLRNRPLAVALLLLVHL